MHRTSLLFSLVLGTTPLARAVNQEPGPAESLERVDAFVYHCSDGDTCRIKVAGALWLNVRLAGIDAPEVSHGKKRPGQPYGDGARDGLNQLIEGKTVKLRQVDLDQYNRPVVELYTGDLLINRKLVEDGLAEAYRGRTKRIEKTAYFDAEESAKKAKRGIWSLSAYESPANFRKSQKR